MISIVYSDKEKYDFARQALGFAGGLSMFAALALIFVPYWDGQSFYVISISTVGFFVFSLLLVGFVLKKLVAPWLLLPFLGSVAFFFLSFRYGDPEVEEVSYAYVFLLSAVSLSMIFSFFMRPNYPGRFVSLSFVILSVFYISVIFGQELELSYGEHHDPLRLSVLIGTGGFILAMYCFCWMSRIRLKERGSK